MQHTIFGEIIKMKGKDLKYAAVKKFFDEASIDFRMLETDRAFAFLKPNGDSVTLSAFCPGCAEGCPKGSCGEEAAQITVIVGSRK